MRALIAITIGLAASAAFVACGSDDKAPASSLLTPVEGGTDSATTPPKDAATDAIEEDGAVSCPTLALGGKLVQATYVGGDPPDETGGTLVPGTYDLTSIEIYLGTPEQGDPDSGPTDGKENSAQATFALTASSWLLAKTFTTMGVLTPLAVTQANVSVESDVELVTTETCPGTAVQKTPFTAKGNTISLHTTQTRRETYTKR